MFNPNENKQNYLSRLKLVVESYEHLTWWSNQNLLKSSKVVKPADKKTLLYNFED